MSGPMRADTKADDLRQALKTAIGHIDHMAAWITKQNAGYSFESLGEDMPAIRILAGTPRRPVYVYATDALARGPMDLAREAQLTRVRAIEAAIIRFRECGVELARFSIQEHPHGVTHLCVDGVSRFTFQIRWPDMGKAF